ncbi:IFN protein, partial [Formicarius rufipectus]|nr:IFN protein [Formicarius rufipectus]
MAVSRSRQPCLWNGTLGLLLVVTALATSLPCQHLWILNNTFPWDALRLLRHMAPNSTETCDLQNEPLIPDTLLQIPFNPQQATRITLSILNHLFYTLSNNHSSQHWQQRPRHRLLNKLQHYIDHLEKCSPKTSRLFKGPGNPLLTIDRYFRDIHHFLPAHNHSACAWEHVRLQAHLFFQRVDKLTRRMR